ncbi:hypothetical protein BH23GEM9_BH23GEM9_08610 [soil metagenome]
MRRCLPLLLLALVPAPVRAQEPLAELWTRLQAATSVEELHEVPLPAGTAGEVAGALVQLRRYELRGRRSDALIGRSNLERMAQRSASAWTHFALGVSLARGPDLRIVVGDDPDVYFATPYSNAAKQAPRSLKRALELEPTLHEAAYTLAELALDLGDGALLRDALARLEHPTRARQPRALELRARVLHQLDDVTGALNAATLLAERGGDPSLASYLRAMALLRQSGGAAEGAQAYFEGAAMLTETSAKHYFDAIVAVLSPTEIERWRTADRVGRGEFLRRYWEVQAALSGVPLEQRLSEHYLRLAVVRRSGRVAAMGAPAIGGGGVVPDARALGVASFADLLLLRHGDPVRDLRIRFCGQEVLDIPLALAPTPGKCARSPTSRMREANALWVGATGLLQRQSGERAVVGTSYSPPFAHYLDVVHELLQFRGSNGLTTLVASVGIPSVSAEHLIESGVLTARVELSLVDTVTSSVVRQDSIRRFRVDRLPEHGWVLLQSEVSTSIRTDQLYRIGVTNERRSVGRVVGGTVDVQDYTSNDLLLSDVLITPEDGVPSFARGAVRLSLAPAREFTTDEHFTLYYEVYGLEAGEAYRTVILVEPNPGGLAERARALLRGARESISLSFAEQASAVHDIYGVQQIRSVGLNGLVPGSYTVRITVTDAAGRSTARARTLLVGRPGPP